MKKILLAIVLASLFCINAFAYQIVTTDDAMYVFKDSKLKKDSHRYKAIYEVNEQNNTLTEIEVTDLNSGEKYESGIVYEIISPPTQGQWFKDSFLKAIRINPKVATVETIVFCKGKFHYSKTHYNYINLASGSYEINIK
tara:strand:- start:75 stop:494 length:420 start_codon:yes stop_codon:yes gene_type:complete